jgi:flagellar protein FliS
MTFAAQYGLQAYGRVGVETGVSGADGHELILMLLDGAITAVGNAGRQMAAGEIAQKGESISKAIAIIDEGLRLALDVESGGPIAQNLLALYDYMSRRLVMANLKNQPAMLDEVKRLLAEIRDAWATVKPPPARAAAPQSPPATARR